MRGGADIQMQERSHCRASGLLRQSAGIKGDGQVGAPRSAEAAASQECSLQGGTGVTGPLGSWKPALLSSSPSKALRA